MNAIKKCVLKSEGRRHFSWWYWSKNQLIFFLQLSASFDLLAPVSRIAKYFRQDGTPLITVGGYTFDFVQNKTTCENEYHMMIRVGLLSFQTIADFTVDIMKT